MPEAPTLINTNGIKSDLAEFDSVYKMVISFYGAYIGEYSRH